MQNVYVISLFYILFSCSDSNINWSSYGNDIQNQRFSDIDEINISNIEQLKLVDHPLERIQQFNISSNANY